MSHEKKITGVVFSDLGQARSFMALEWVQRLLAQKIGFVPYAGTLNLRLTTKPDMALWKDLQQRLKGVEIPPPQPSFCSARAFPARIEKNAELREDKRRVAVLVPAVEGYPEDKVEVIAPFHVKRVLQVEDGDPLTLEFTGD